MKPIKLWRGVVWHPDVFLHNFGNAILFALAVVSYFWIIYRVIDLWLPPAP